MNCAYNKKENPLLVFCVLLLVVIFSLAPLLKADLPHTQMLYLGDTAGSNSYPNLCPPYLYAGLDAAGYSEAIYWGPSTVHHYNYHELLSGE